MSKQSTEPGPIGILAGAGDLPCIAAREALRAGEDIRIFSFTDRKMPPDLLPHTVSVVLTKLYTSVIRTVKKHRVQRLLLLGKVTRDVIYDKPRFDLRVLLLLSRLKDQSDTRLFEAVQNVFEKKGIQILPQTSYLESLFLPVGQYARKCTAREWRDVLYGLAYAREINRLDIGQTVVVGRKCVLAVECAEGSNRCIQRGGELFHKKGAVVCKLGKQNHDARFDIPTLGCQTLETMQAAGCRTLAFEAQKTFVLDPPQFIQTARKLGITVIALATDSEKLPRFTNKQNPLE